MKEQRLVSIALIGLLSLAVWRWWPRDAEFYYHRGQERLEYQDEDGGNELDGALADFNRAIRLNPKFAAAYASRALVQENISRPEEAIADFEHAIRLDPRNALHYKQRAAFREFQGDLDGAIADLDRAIELSPKDDSLFSRRAYLKHKRGDLSGMVADLERAREIFPRELIRLNTVGAFGSKPTIVLNRLLHRYDRAIRQDPDFAWGYYHRGVLKHLAADLDGAQEDFQRCFEFPDARLKDYAAIHRWLVRAQKNETSAADAELSAYFSARRSESPRDWEVQIARFLLGRINEEEFSTAVGGPSAEWEQSQFWYYTGMKHLLAGNKVKAANYLRASRTTETRPYAVEISAQIELGLLNE